MNIWGRFALYLFAFTVLYVFLNVLLKENIPWWGVSILAYTGLAWFFGETER